MSCLTLWLVLIVTRTVFLDVGVSAGLIIVNSAGIGVEAKQEQRELGNKTYSFVVWMVLFILLVVMGFCVRRKQETVLVLLCCVTTIVLVSKATDQVL